MMMKLPSEFHLRNMKNIQTDSYISNLHIRPNCEHILTLNATIYCEETQDFDTVLCTHRSETTALFNMYMQMSRA